MIGVLLHNEIELRVFIGVCSLQAVEESWGLVLWCGYCTLCSFLSSLSLSLVLVFSLPLSLVLVFSFPLSMSVSRS